MRKTTRQNPNLFLAVFALSMVFLPLAVQAQVQTVPPGVEGRNRATATDAKATSTPAAATIIDAQDAESRGDLATAFSLFIELADQGSAVAQARLGLMYKNGIGVLQNYITAMTLFRKAAEQNEVDAVFNIGSMYANGEGVRKDYAKASAWYQRAANQADEIVSSFAQVQLGQLYQEGGHGLTQNYVQAYKWYDIAAKHTPYDPQRTCAISDTICSAAFQRDFLAIRMTDEQISEAEQLERAWKTSARPARGSLPRSLGRTSG